MVDDLVVRLPFRAPFDGDALLTWLAARAVPGVEEVDGDVYRRSLRLPRGPGVLELALGADSVRCRLWLEDERDVAPAEQRCRRLLDLDADPVVVAEHLGADPLIGGLVRSAPGLRVPGSVEGAELAVRAVLGQQVTVAAARTLARRLVERFGADIATPWRDVTRTFPGPAELATVPLERIAELGIIRSRAGAIQALATRWESLAALLSPGASPDALVDALRELPGIGPWTAHYIAMRALGWPDAFPPGDVAALKAMGHLFTTTTQRQAEAHAESWRPWRAYALLRLWNSLGVTP